MTSTIDGVEAPPLRLERRQFEFSPDFAVVGRAIDVLSLGATLSATFQREVDVVELELDSPIPLLRAVLREGRRIYERTPGAAATFASRARSVLDLDGPSYDLMMRAFMARVAQRGVGT